MECRYCKECCCKAGHSRNGTQRFRCKTCKKYQQETYASEAYQSQINSSITSLLTEGMGMRSIARVLKISINTVASGIRSIAYNARPAETVVKHDDYEIDEL